MARRRNRFVQWLLAAATVSAARLLALLPLPLARGVGKCCARVASWCIPRMRQVTMANLEYAYGDRLSAAEKQRIYQGAIANLGIVAAEFPRVSRLQGDAIWDFVSVEGIDNIDRTRGGFMIGAHLGNWEWMAPVTVACGFKTAEVVRPLDAPLLNRYVDRMRRSTGVVTIPKDGAGREVIRLLREGWIVGVLMDQQPRENAAPVNFFGQPCWSTIAPVMAALRARVPVYPVGMVRDKKGHYRFQFHPPLEMSRSGDFRADLVANCQRCQDVIEAIVREAPEQWLWLHRRWKRRDLLEREWAKRGEKKDSASPAIPAEQGV